MTSPARTYSARPLLAWLLLLSTLMVSGLIMLGGCNGMMANPPGSPGQTTAFAFVSNSGSGTVSAFAVSSGGGLSVVPGSPFAAGSGAEFMAFDSVHKLL